MQTFELFGAKNLGFFKFMVCPLGQRLSQCGHFVDKGLIFRDFVRDVFYKRSPRVHNTLYYMMECKYTSAS